MKKDMILHTIGKRLVRNVRTLCPSRANSQYVLSGLRNLNNKDITARRQRDYGSYLMTLWLVKHTGSVPLCSLDLRQGLMGFNTAKIGNNTIRTKHFRKELTKDNDKRQDMKTRYGHTESWNYGVTELRSCTQKGRFLLCMK